MRLKGLILVSATLAMLAAPAIASAQVGVQVGRFGVSVGQPYYDYGYNGGWYGYQPGYYGYGAYPGYYGPRYYPYRTSYYYAPGNWYYSPADYVSPTFGYRAVPTNQAAPATEVASTAEPARVRIRLPENARLWFDDTETSMRGTDRVFTSPPLEQGHVYAWTIKAQWMENGREVTRTRRVSVQPGDLANVNFLLPANGTAPQPALQDASRNNNNPLQ